LCRWACRELTKCRTPSAPLRAGFHHHEAGVKVGHPVWWNTTFVGEKRKAKVCYTGFALSDLAVSSGLPFVSASLPGTDFSPKPLQRIPISLPPGDFALDCKHGLKRGFEQFGLPRFFFFCDWTGPRMVRMQPGSESERGSLSAVCRLAYW